MTRLAGSLRAQLSTLVEAELIHTEQDLPELQPGILEAGEDPAAVVSTFAEIVVSGLINGAAELPLEVAVRARVTGGRLAAGGFGLESLVELILAIQREAEVLLLEEAPSPAVGLATVLRLNRVVGAVVLTLTRSHVKATWESHIEQERALRALIRIARAVARSLEPSEVAEAGLLESVAATEVDAGAVWLAEAGRKGLSLHTSVGLTAEELKALQTERAYRQTVFDDAQEIPAISPLMDLAKARAAFLKEQSQSRRQQAKSNLAGIDELLNSPLPSVKT